MQGRVAVALVTANGDQNKQKQKKTANNEQLMEQFPNNIWNKMLHGEDQQDNNRARQVFKQ